jgi:hypothetical protein
MVSQRHVHSAVMDVHAIDGDLRSRHGTAAAFETTKAFRRELAGPQAPRHDELC